MTVKTSQKERVRALLKSGKSLTQLQARTQYRIASLSSRVNELRQEGMDIVSKRRQVKDRKTGETKTVVRYILA